MLRLMIILLICTVIGGCSGKERGEMMVVPSSGEREVDTESGSPESEDSESGGAGSEAGTKAESTKASMSKEEQMEAVRFLEQFESELTFTDMEPAQASFYGEALDEGYDFIGRMTDEGYGYVLGFKREGSDLLAGLSVYGKDDYVEAGQWNEEEDEEEVIYTFLEISDLYQGEGNEVIYIQPSDYTMPEELQNVFLYRYCDGQDGIRYLEDVMERGVRFTPPSSGAYLSVDRFENGRQRWEYIPLTEKEEMDLLASSSLIAPELYGKFGLQFFLSQESYEEMGRGEGMISSAALDIAKERCRFQVWEPQEIHDIVKAELCFIHYEENMEESVDAGASGTTDRKQIKETEVLTDPDRLARLVELLSSSVPSDEGKCPYSGVLTLTREDGEEIVVHLAMDSCDGFVLGSHGIYSPGKEGTEQLWSLFPEIREFSGWGE